MLGVKWNHVNEMGISEWSYGTLYFYWDAISHSCPYFYDSLAKPSLKLFSCLGPFY